MHLNSSVCFPRHHNPELIPRVVRTTSTRIQKQASANMEIVNEHEETLTPSQSTNTTLEDERNRMQMSVQSRANSMAAPPSRKPSVSRQQGRSLPVRASSMRAVRPLAPTKSTDAMSSMRGNNLQRANSSRLHRTTSSRGPPRGRGGNLKRTSSIDSTNSLRAFRREQLTNSAIEPKDMNTRMRGPGATLQRHESGGDVSVLTTSDLSCFTMDSVNLRKTQMVADPIDDAGTYNGEDNSYADHESISRASMFSEYPAQPPSRGVSRHMSCESVGDAYNCEDSCADHESISRASVFSEYPAQPSRGIVKYMSSESLGPMRFDRLQINNPVEEDEGDDNSFGSMTSGLTTDFTDHDFIDDYSEGCDDEAKIEEAKADGE